MKWYRVVLYAAGAALVGCSSGGVGSTGDLDYEVNQIELATPTSSLPPPGTGSPALRAQTFDLASIGYEEVEFFLEGTATWFTQLNAFLIDGQWDVEPAGTAPYKIRIVMHRPIDPADARARTVVEWLDVSADVEAPRCWANGHVEMYRSGTVWVGVSAQIDGIEGFPGSLKSENPERYNSLSHPGDSYSYDIFTQVSAALRRPTGEDPMGGRPTGNIIACGHTEAADRLVTWTNAIEPIYFSSGYNGIIIASRDRVAGWLSQPPEPLREPGLAQIREDNDHPVLNLQTETDVIERRSSEIRQPDSNSFRLWEVAGASNLDYYSTTSGRGDATGDPMSAAVVEVSQLEDGVECNQPVNSEPYHYVFSQGLQAMGLWASGGVPAKPAERLELDPQGDLVLDVNGNSVGGLRSPFVDAPTATLSGLGNTGSRGCGRLGTTALFAADRMASLYVDQAGYVEAVTQAANLAVRNGHLTQEDADAIIAWAPSQWDSQVTP